MKRFISVTLAFLLIVTFNILPLGTSFEVKADSTTVSVAPDAGDITVTNNVTGTPDTVYVENLSTKDVVKVYNAATGGKLLGSATASSSTLDATVKTAQLGTTSGSVYVSITSTACLESTRTEADYDAELTTDAPDPSEIIVTNNAKGTPDTVYVDDLSPRDVLKVYSAATGGTLFGSATVLATGSDATVKITELGATSGFVYVTISTPGLDESVRVKAAYDAEPVTPTPDIDNITVTNNATGTPDTVYVDDLNLKDIVKVYSAASGGKLLGSATASTSTFDATIKITQLGTIAGNVYVTITSAACLESLRTPAAYGAEPITTYPDANNITVTNNATGITDTVYVANLNIKDVVKVYSALTGGKLLGTATASSSTFDATVKIAQLSITSGSVFVSVTSSACLESTRTEAPYAAEAVSDSPDVSNIVVTNNAKGTSDTICVNNLSPKDIIKAYTAATGGQLLGSATVSASGSAATITVTQLGVTGGSVYVSVTSYEMDISARVKATYAAESATTAPDISANDITVTNNATGTPDTVYLDNLNLKDVVKVYNAATGGTLLGSVTASPTNFDVTIKISQLGTASGSVYISVTSTGSIESVRVPIVYAAEAISDAPVVSDITVTNNAKGTSDTVYVDNLNPKDFVKVYSAATGGTLLGSTTVLSGGSDATITIPQLGASAGSVYVSVTSYNMDISARTPATYTAELTSTAPSDIVVTNNPVNTSDTVYVDGLSPGDIVKVYNSSTNATVIGKATATGTDATVTIAQLGTTSGSVYVTVTSIDDLESSRTVVAYSAENTSTAPLATNITITNNATSSDTICVIGLQENDIVKVYKLATGGTAIGTATVASGATSATVSISQTLIGTAAGSVYVTVTSTSCLESSRVTAPYAAVVKSTAPSLANITVSNNAGAADTVYVSGLAAGDIINVYNSLTGGTLLGTATVAAYATSATVSISQLGVASGNVYVTVTSTNCLESSRATAPYAAKTQTTAPNAANITVNNNYLSASTVVVTGLVAGDIVNIYSAASGGTLLGTGTVALYAMNVNVSISQLNTAGGKIYVTLTAANESESTMTPITYSANTASIAPLPSDVTIVNNSGIQDTITVTGVTSGTIINVYSAATGGKLLVTATAKTTSITISIDQLGVAGGSVFITATSTNCLESTRTECDYIAEAASGALLTGNVSIVNNSGSADTITITGLSVGDVINVYRAATGGTSIATVTATGNLTTILSISQLGTTAGNVYVSVTSSGNTESARTTVSYVAESPAPSASNITIVNNAGIAGTINVTGLISGEVVNVYNAASGGTLLGTATVASGTSSVTISVSQLSSAAGYAYVSVTSSGCAESSLTKVSYIAQQTTQAPDEGNIDIVNNYGINSTVTVSGLNPGDVIEVYDSSENLLGHVTVATSATSGTVSIASLGISAGNVYVTIKGIGKIVSDATSVPFAAETATSAVNGANVSIVNNLAGTPDTITVTGLTSGTLIQVYSAATGGNYLGSMTVASGATSATVSIAQLGTSSGSVYITLTSTGTSESIRIPVNYAAEL